MLALSLQSDGELLSGGGDDSQWSGIWDYNIGKTPSTSGNTPLFPPNNNYPNFTTGTNAVVEDPYQTGNCCNRLIKKKYYKLTCCIKIKNMIFTEAMLPCEFCEELFPEEDLILHQVRKK